MNPEAVGDHLVAALELDVDEERARRRDPFLHRLRCDQIDDACPVQPALAYACRRCAEVIYGLVVTDEEAERQSRLLANAADMWALLPQRPPDLADLPRACERCGSAMEPNRGRPRKYCSSCSGKRR